MLSPSLRLSVFSGLTGLAGGGLVGSQIGYAQTHATPQTGHAVGTSGRPVSNGVCVWSDADLLQLFDSQNMQRQSFIERF